MYTSYINETYTHISSCFWYVVHFARDTKTIQSLKTTLFCNYFKIIWTVLCISPSDFNRRERQ